MLGDSRSVKTLILRVCLLIVSGVGLFGGFTASVVSASSDDYSIIASVQNQTLVDGSTSRTPVAGVAVTVTKADGSKIGDGVTDESGLCTIVVPSRDDYLISIDPSSLPEGLALIDADKSTVSISKDLFTTNTKRVTFFTGEGASSGASETERILQRLSDGIRLGIIIAMCSVGLSLVFGTTGLTNFAHGEMVTFGGLMAFFFNVILEIPILISGPVVIVKQLSSYSKQVNIEIGPIGITPRDLTTAILGVIILVSVALFLQRSRLGKAIRAVSDNVQLASATGIDTRKVIKIVWFAGGALAATGGIFRGLDEQVSFSMGSDLLFLMFAGITLGGLGSAFGALIGGFFIGIFVEMSSLFVPSELKVAPALFILIVVLIVRPQGILGKSQRVG